MAPLSGSPLGSQTEQPHLGRVHARGLDADPQSGDDYAGCQHHTGDSGLHVQAFAAQAGIIWAVKEVAADVSRRYIHRGNSKKMSAGVSRRLKFIVY
jgi:hypothetical protein